MRLLHLSDLHFVDAEGASRVETRDRAPFGNQALINNLESLRGELHRADLVIVSGDVTDTGTRAQWSAFKTAVGRFPNLSAKIVLVPGNHDFNHVASLAQLHTADSPNFDDRKRRRALFRATQDELAGLAAESSESSLELGDDERAPFVRKMVSPAGIKVTVVGINTVVPSINTFGNAVGNFEIGSVLSVLQQAQREGNAVVIVGHHHPLPHFDSYAPPRSTRKTIVDIAFGIAMEAINGIHFLNRLSETLVEPALYLHGHKHIYRVHADRVTGLQICGAPSLLFGDESTGRRNRIAARHRIEIAHGRVTFISEPVDLAFPST